MEKLLKRAINRFSICLYTALAVSICVVLLPAQSGSIAAKDPKAKEVMDAAINALGGAEKIGEIKSLILKGTRTAGAAKNEFEIRILLPDSFVRIDRRSTGTGYTGVSQGKPIPYAPITMPQLVGAMTGEGAQTPKPKGSFGKIIMGGNTNKGSEQTTPNPKGGVAGTTDGNANKGSEQTTPNPKGEFTISSMDGKLRATTTYDDYMKAHEAVANHNTNNRKDEWLYFLAGMLMKTSPASLTLSSGSKRGVFALTKNDSTAGEIEFDLKTGFPTSVRYSEIVYRNPEISYLSGNGFGDGTVREHAIQFRDHFSVIGVMFPRVIATESYELRIEEVLINPDLSLKDFEF